MFAQISDQDDYRDRKVGGHSKYIVDFIFSPNRCSKISTNHNETRITTVVCVL